MEGSYLSTREANSYHTQVLRVGQELGLDHACVQTLVVVVVTVGDASFALLVCAAVAVASRGGSAVFEGWRDHDECVGRVEGVVVGCLLWVVSLFPRIGGGGGDHGKDCCLT